MLGYQISIYIQNPGQTSYELMLPNESLLATWVSNDCSLDWLKKLETSGKAEFVGGIGYPDIYFAKADDILPLILPKSPTDLPPVLADRPPGVMYFDEKFNLDKIAACPSDQMLQIEAMDQS
ncbi:MAG: hypothetical protein JRG71_01255 [Deltaproteobacteria bacterium]|jgi:hypothetical protein|nr:hypothetical protein [Deltaproteobacteria bacterium]